MKIYNILVPVIFCLIIFVAIILTYPKIHNKSEEIYIKHDESSEFFNQTPEEGLKQALEYYEIDYPEIVYAQAIHETGNFKSRLCRINNNLFGLYNSKAERYYSFNHWTKSVEMYKNRIQNRLKKNEDYYVFLERICYASDSNYVNTIKRIVINESSNSK